jgi:hypothetical protein
MTHDHMLSRFRSWHCGIDRLPQIGCDIASSYKLRIVTYHILVDGIDSIAKSLH